MTKNLAVNNCVETAENRDLRILGLYPGCIKDINAVDNFSEVDLYFAIDYIGGFVWRCEHDMADERMPEVDLTEQQFALEYLVYQTTRFGVELPEPKLGEHVPVTESYRAWFKFFSNHFKHGLTNEQWGAYQRAKVRGEDVSAFMPSGHWTDLLEKKAPEKKLK